MPRELYTELLEGLGRGSGRRQQPETFGLHEAALQLLAVSRRSR